MRSLVHEVIARAKEKSNQGRLSTKAVKSIPGLLSNYGEGNCWGTTMWMLGVKREPEFLSGTAMHDWLIANARLVRKPRFGDVLVLRAPDLSTAMHDDGNPEPISNDRIRHTCVMVGPDLYWHQIGYGGQYALQTLAEVQLEYPGSELTWMRVK